MKVEVWQLRSRDWSAGPSVKGEEARLWPRRQAGGGREPSAQSSPAGPWLSLDQEGPALGLGQVVLSPNSGSPQASWAHPSLKLGFLIRNAPPPQAVPRLRG